jgi:hypothetical protein
LLDALGYLRNGGAAASGGGLYAAPGLACGNHPGDASVAAYRKKITAKSRAAIAADTPKASNGLSCSLPIKRILAPCLELAQQAATMLNVKSCFG